MTYVSGNLMNGDMPKFRQGRTKLPAGRFGSRYVDLPSAPVTSSRAYGGTFGVAHLFDLSTR